MKPNERPEDRLWVAWSGRPDAHLFGLVKPNNSLDRSGGSVFRIMTGAVS